MARFGMPRQQWLDGNGRPLAGGKLYFYATATTTPLNTYSDSALSTPNANPVVADSAGVWGDIFLSGSAYKVVLKDADDATIWTADPVQVPLISSFAATLLDDTTAAAMRVTLDAQEDVITAQGDIIVGNASGVAARLARGTANHFLAATASTVAYRALLAADLPAASDTAIGGIEIAVQSEMEAGSSTTLAVVAGRQHFHPSAAKAWVKFNPAGTIQASYNVTSVSDGGTGTHTVNWATDFSSADYALAYSLQQSSTLNLRCGREPLGAGRVNTQTRRVDTQALTDVNFLMVVGFGDFA